MDIFFKFFLPAGLSFIIGIYLFSLLGFVLPFFVPIIVIFSVLLTRKVSGLQTPTFFYSIIILFISLWLGGIHTSYYSHEDKTNLNRKLENEIVQVISDVETVNGLIRYTVLLEDETKALLTTFSHLKYPYKSLLYISGDLKEPPVFDDFDYRAYLKKEGINAIIYLPEVSLKEKGRFSLLGNLFTIKNSLRLALHSSLPYPHNTIAGAMLLGDGDRVPENIGNLFSSTGIRHIIAISGLHVTIIAGMLLVLFSSFLRMKRNNSFYITSFFIILFVIFVGAPPSAIRAGIMALIFLFAFKVGKVYNAPRALFVAALLMLIFNPLLLFYDIGFQLSFLAVSGILYLTPHIEHLLGRKKSFLDSNNTTVSFKKSLVSMLAVSIGAHIATLPIVAYNFGIISFSSPIANLVAVPLLPVIVVSGFSAAVLGSASSFLGNLFAFPAFLSLELIIQTSRFLDSLPISSLDVKINTLWVVIIYSVLFISAVLLNSHKNSSTSTTLSSAQSPLPENKPF